MIDFSNFNSLIELTSYFNSDKKCRKVIREQRWGKNIICPVCGSTDCVERKDGRFRCHNCGHTFSETVGTIFENSKLSLQKWFIAMYLISSHKKGISSHQLSRDIHVTQTTAWYLLEKIRSLYAQDDSDTFNGTVECDEVYIGGREKWKHKSMRTPHTQGRSTKTKTPVFGMMERRLHINEYGKIEHDTHVHAIVVENTNRDTLQPIIEQFVATGSKVVTDELNAYKGLDVLGFDHAVVKHGAEEYVKDKDVYTNSIEGFWSHFRRMITGCYHDVSDAHLQSYIDEAVYRWNTRKMSESKRFAQMFNRSIGLIVRWADLKLCQAA